jgi:glutathione S-transferase
VLEEAMEFVIATLSKSPYLLGDKFSAADVLYGTTFAMFGQSAMLPKSPVIEEYANRVIARPAYQRAQGKDNG